MTRPHCDQEPGVHNVTARGNARGAIFVDDDDRRLYRVRLEWAAIEFEWDVLLWCLMTNHVHLLIATKKCNLSAGMQQLHGRYAQLFNERHGRVGHLFGGRFWSAPVESDEHFETLCGYVANNPVAAGLVPEWRLWPWVGGSLLESSRRLAA